MSKQAKCITTRITLSFLTEIKKSHKARVYRLCETIQPTGDERIELPPKVLETPIIPLDQSPI